MREPEILSDIVLTDVVLLGEDGFADDTSSVHPTFTHALAKPVDLDASELAEMDMGRRS
jgi:hypothetical protein